MNFLELFFLLKKKNLTVNVVSEFFEKSEKANVYSTMKIGINRVINNYKVNGIIIDHTDKVKLP